MVLVAHLCRLLPLALVLAAPVAWADDAADERSFVVENCRVVTVGADEIPDGVVVVRKGRIEAVGARADVKRPEDLPSIDGGGGTLTPAFTHPASRLGLRGNGGGNSGTTDPARDATDDLNPWLSANRWTAATGFATLGLLPGQGAVGGRGPAVRTAADSIEGMVRRADALLRVDVDGGRFTSSLTRALKTARGELDAKAKYERDHAKWLVAKAEAEGKKKKAPKEPSKPKSSDKNEPYRKVLLGETALFALVGDSADVSALTRALADEHVRGEELRLYAWVSGEAVRAASQLADLGAVCVVRARIEDWPGTADRFSPTMHYLRNGCRVILVPAAETRDALRSFPYGISRVVRAGMPRADALRAAFAGPAEFLGLEEETGTIAVGRRADLILWSTDPLAAAVDIRRVWVDGEAVEETP